MLKPLLRWLGESPRARRDRARRNDLGTGRPLAVELLEARNLPAAFLPSDAPAFIDIKDTAYAIPATDAYFVAPDGLDTNLGTIDSPWTVQKAIATAPSGSTVIFRGGVYRDVDNLSITRQLTLQPFPHEKAWLKGSTVVTGWEADGAVWRKDGWVYEFPHLLGPEYIDPNFPLAGNRDMVFIDGQARTQVGTLEEIEPGTFYVDYANDQLYLGDDPTGRTVESTVSVTAFVPRRNAVDDGSGTVIRGLGFTHYADWGVQLSAPLNVLENNTFVWNGQEGARVLNPDAVLRGNIFTANGRKGVGVGQGHRLLLESNVLSFNNVERYSATWDAAAIKIVRTQDMLLRDNLVERNYGTGIWMDISCIRATVIHNVSRFNRGLADRSGGIFAELQHDSIIAFNVCYGNGTGIVVADSSNIRVWNNTLADNGQAVIVRDSTRENVNPTELAEGITWITRDVVVKNNLFSDIRLTGPTGPLFDATGTAFDDSSVLLVTGLDFNAYYRSNPTRPANVIRWDPGPGGTVSYATLAAFRAVYPEYEANGFAIDGGPNPFFVDGSAGDFRLLPGSLAVLRGEPLPPDVAAAVGLPAGEPVHLGARGVAVELLPLHVISFAASLGGVSVQFNRPIDPDVLNLYDTRTGSLGPPDLTLVGDATGPVRGSLVIDATATRLTFLRTGGVLPADTYTLTLRSAANAFRTPTGGLLDGNADGTASDDYAAAFTAAPPAVSVGLPDFTRGPGQPIVLPAATGIGLPLHISNGEGVESIDLTLRFDPALFHITDAVLGPTVPANAVVVLDTATPGEMRLTFHSPTPLPSGPIDFAILTAQVPLTSANVYTRKQVVDVTDLRVNDGLIAAADDDAIHVNAFVGDVTANGSYSSGDATRVLRVAVGLDTGFGAFPLADPVLIADVTGNGAVTFLDVTRILQEAVGIDRPELPNLPPGPLIVSATGPDPLLQFGKPLPARPGQTVTLPLLLGPSDGLTYADLAISYDAERLELVGVRPGRLTRDFDVFLVNHDAEAGTIRVGLGRSQGPIHGRGTASVLELTFRVRTNAPKGRAVVNLRQSVGTTVTHLNEGGLDLIPDPSNDEGDVLDGAILVRQQAARRWARDLIFASGAGPGPGAAGEFFRTLLPTSMARKRWPG